MRFIKKILAVPIIILLELLRFVADLLIKVECWVAGVGFLLLAIFSLLAVINKQWLTLGVFLIITTLGIVIIMLSAHILLWIDILKDLIT